MIIVKVAYDLVKQKIDYDIVAHESFVKENDDGFSVFEKGSENYLLTFGIEAQAKDFAKAFDEANLRRKGVGRVWEKFLPFSLDKDKHIKEENKVLRTPFEQEQEERDEVLAPYNLEERKDRFKNLKNKGLPHVPELKTELEEFRTSPAAPHGIERPAIPGFPDVPSVREIRDRNRLVQHPKLVAFVSSICKFAQAA